MYNKLVYIHNTNTIFLFPFTLLSFFNIIMNEAARVILTKLTLVDPTTSTFSAYQQSAEVIKFIYQDI